MCVAVAQRQQWAIFLILLACALHFGCGGAVSAGSGGPAPTPTPDTSGTPVVAISATTLTFGSQIVNTTSAGHSVTLSNSGNGRLNIASIATSAEYQQTNTCGTGLARETNCTITVSFTPAGAGTRTGTLTITDNAGGSPHQVSLSGTGIASDVTLTPASLSFGNQVINTQSGERSVTVRNAGSASFGISSIAASGEYSQTNTCGSSIAPGAECTIRVLFRPTTTGTRNGTLTVSGSGSGSSYQVPLTGVGVAPAQLSVSPTSLSFGSVIVGQGKSLSVTATNSGGTNLTISSASTEGPGFGLSGLSVPAVLTPGQSRSFSVSFNPSNAGAASGNVYLGNTTAVATVTIPLTGTGTAAPSHSVSLSWNESVSEDVVGYAVYRSTQSGGPYTKISTALVSGTAYQDTDVDAGATYTYVVTAVNGSDVESNYSNEAAALVPTP